MKITREQVARVAELSRLEIGEEEIEKFAVQLSAILSYMEKLNRVDTSNVEPMLTASRGSGIRRDDIPRPVLPRDEALANAPDAGDGFFRVPPVIE